jgi:thiol-disulfide isomerase/thioredoxin
MKVILIFYFCLLDLVSLPQDTDFIKRYSSGKFPDSITTYYDENGKTIDAKVFHKKTLTGYYNIQLGVHDYDPKFGTLSLVKRPMPELEWINKEVPKFEFPDLDGKSWSKKSITGKLVVFHFWFTKCGVCIKEIPLLNEIKKNYPDVLWFAISYEDSETLKSFLHTHKVDLTVVPFKKDFAKTLKVNNWPVTFLIKDRVIKEVLYGVYGDSTLLRSRIAFYSDRK